jgi:hypothetical protein
VAFAGRPIIAGAAVAGLAVLAAATVAFGVALQQPRYGVLLAAGVGLGAAARAGLRRRWSRRSRVLALAGALALMLVTSCLLLAFCGGRPGDFAPTARPYVSIAYRAQVDASGPGTTMTETLICDQQFEDNLARALPTAPPSKQSLVEALTMPDDWRAAGSLDGSPIYVRTSSLPPFGSGRFGVDQLTIDVDLGIASLGRQPDPPEEFALVPADKSTIAITAPKGAVGASDPAADQVTDLPGGAALQQLSINTASLREAIVLDVLGTALRNPAGRTFYEAGSWGYLPWALGVLVLACSALAADVVRERVRAIITRTKPAPAPTRRPANRRKDRRPPRR